MSSPKNGECFPSHLSFPHLPVCFLESLGKQITIKQMKLQQTTTEIILVLFLTGEDGKTLCLCAPWLWGWSFGEELMEGKPKVWADLCSGSLRSLPKQYSKLLPKRVGRATSLPPVFLWSDSKLNGQWFSALSLQNWKAAGLAAAGCSLPASQR